MVRLLHPLIYVERLTDRFSHVSVNKSYNVLFGAQNINMASNGSSADLILDKYSGSGLASKNKYYHGFFNVALKLPSGYTSGVVAALYLSNSDVYPKNHDEIDFELLGHEETRDWVLQTNLYGNGSVSTGREEKLSLWFDPTLAYHTYTILWNNHHIVFMVDNVHVREVIYNRAISLVYPSKPMSIYLTIWDGSQWATHGGKYPVDYKYAPFNVSMSSVEIDGCIQQQNNNASTCSKSNNPSSLDPIDGEEFVKLSEKQEMGMGWARKKHMFYSYCMDAPRYKVLPPECNI
ncbi:hydrolase [Lithospermum erythrorhizon]|uniref:Xyloglucan endotransglucosylase/hydrolase n=1 Tax=Lithospermum erythrorhizon TaxID=34254 RepID=A0AAV3RE93_LITER